MKKYLNTYPQTARGISSASISLAFVFITWAWADWLGNRFFILTGLWVAGGVGGLYTLIQSLSYNRLKQKWRFRIGVFLGGIIVYEAVVWSFWAEYYRLFVLAGGLASVAFVKIYAWSNQRKIASKYLLITLSSNAVPTAFIGFLFKYGFSKSVWLSPATLVLWTIVGCAFWQVNNAWVLDRSQ
jgi:hypothetical protein